MPANTRSSRLRNAIRVNDLPLVQRILKIEPGLLYNPDYAEKADTSLHIAASLGLLKIAQHLIDLGHDEPDSIPRDCRFDEITELNHGISINTEGRTPLHLAAANLHTSVVELLCETFPSTINRRDRKGQTALMLAAGAQAKPVVSALASSANTTVRTTEDISTVSTLLDFGAEVVITDAYGNTCLHNACAYGNLKTIRLLVQAGADPLALNIAGWKPELYSLTVQAEVYYRNLVAEFGKRKAEEKRAIIDRSGKSAGSVRLVAPDEDGSDDADSTIQRSRADSGRSHDTFESAMS